MEEDFGFTFMSPELKTIKLSEYLKRRAASEGYYVPEDPLELLEGREEGDILVPTHHFVMGKPDPAQVQEHALQMWKEVKEKVHQNRREIIRYGLGGDVQDYGINREREQTISKDSKHLKKISPEQQEMNGWGKWRKPENIVVNEPESESQEPEQRNFDWDDDIPF